MMRLRWWLFALLTATAPAFAAGPTTFGPLQSQLNGSDINNPAEFRANLGLPSSATVDTTNASNITSGTLPPAQLPTPTSSSLGGVQSIGALAHQWLSYIDLSGVPHQTQPTAGDILGLAPSATTDTTNAANITSGTLAAGRLPSPTATTLGGVQSVTALAHQWLSYIDLSGVPHQSQPTAGDILGLAPSATTDTTNAANITSGTLAAARLPSPTATTLGGVQSVTALAHQWMSYIDLSGVPHQSQPSAGDILGLAPSATTDTTNAANITSGTLAAARLPAPTATTPGGVQSVTALAHQWISAISGSGVPVLSQPGFSDLTGNPSLSQVTTGLGFVPLAPSNNLSDLSNAATARTNLGLGSAATYPIGASGTAVPLLSAANTWGVAQTFADGLATATMIDLRASCGAKGNGTTDDSAALKFCIGLVNAAYAAGGTAWLHVPAGYFHITGANGAMPAFAQTVPGVIMGDGQHQSYITMDATYAGALFSWSDAWEGTAGAIYNPGPFIPSEDKAGATVSGLTISGSLTASAEQDGLMFYDHEDHILVQNVDLFFIPGYGISTGQNKNDSSAYTRESKFDHVKLWFAGSATEAAFDWGATAGGGGDTDFDDIDIYAFKSAGMTLRVPTASASFGQMRFSHLRVEGNENGTATGNNINVGLSSDLGVMADVTFDGTQSYSPSTGNYAVSVGASSANQQYSISFLNSDISGTVGGGGLYINNDRLFRFSGQISTSGTSVTFGPNLGSDISLMGYGQSSATWTYAYSALPYGGAINYIASPASIYGIPASSNKVGMAAMRGTATGATAVRLTMDGAAPNAQNCFNPGYSSGFNMAIQFLAQDTTSLGKSYAWNVPVAYFQAPYNAASASLSLGTPATLSNGTLTGMAFSATADTTNGCLNLSFTPPTSNTDTWSLSALITFVRN